MAHQVPSQRTDTGRRDAEWSRPEQFRAVPIELITGEGDFGQLWEPYYSDFLRESDAALATT